MKKFIATVALGVMASGASAATIDLTDNTFSSTQYVTFVQGPLGPINQFVETVQGVDFTFATTGQFRNVGTWGNGTSNSSAPWALTFGGGGGNTSSFTLSVSEDVQLNSYLGIGPLNTGNVIPVFDVTGVGVSSLGNTFTNYGAFGSPGQSYSFANGPLSLVAGGSYLFTTTNASANTTSSIYSFDFEKRNGNGVGAAVPLPAGLPLLLTGLFGFGLLRRRS